MEHNIYMNILEVLDNAFLEDIEIHMSFHIYHVNALMILFLLSNNDLINALGHIPILLLFPCKLKEGKKERGETFFFFGI